MSSPGTSFTDTQGQYLAFAVHHVYRSATGDLRALCDRALQTKSPARSMRRPGGALFRERRTPEEGKAASPCRSMAVLPVPTLAPPFGAVKRSLSNR
jgi:hypothetical protein